MEDASVLKFALKDASFERARSKHMIDLVTSESRFASWNPPGRANVFTIRVQWHLRLQASWRGLHPIGLYLPHEAIAVTAGILFAATNSATWLAYAVPR